MVKKKNGKIFITDKFSKSILLFVLFMTGIGFTGFVLQEMRIIPRQRPLSRLFAANAMVHMSATSGVHSTATNINDGSVIITENNVFKNISPEQSLDTIASIPVYPFPIQTRSNSSSAGPLDPFYAALSRNLIATNKYPVKAALFGDSVVAGDIFPYYFRKKIQAIFGYGGPGFVCMAKPYRYYFNNDVKWDQEGNWRVSGVFDRFPRNAGINGFLFTASNGGKSLFNCPVNRSHAFNRINLYYLASPGGKYFQVSVNSNRTLIDSYNPSNICVAGRISASQNMPFEISCGKKQKASFYGVEFVRTNAGFVLDTFPVQGANSGHMLKISRQTWQRQLGTLRPDIAIVMYDINLYGYTNFPAEAYRNQFRLFIDRLRSANTNLPVLIISPMGKAERKGPQGQWHIMNTVQNIINAQKEVALEKNCAFINLYNALGGERALPAWYGSVIGEEMLNADGIHLSYKGADKLSEVLFTMLMTDYRKYLVRHHMLKTESAETQEKPKGKNAF